MSYLNVWVVIFVFLHFVLMVLSALGVLFIDSRLKKWDDAREGQRKIQERLLMSMNANLEAIKQAANSGERARKVELRDDPVAVVGVAVEAPVEAGPVEMPPASVPGAR